MTTTPRNLDSRRPRLWIPVAFGLVAGVLYAWTNTMFDVWDRKSPLVDTLATVHGFVDRGVPVIVGALLGLSVHYIYVRAELFRSEARRAEDLSARLQKIERDQAIWVVAAATLHDVQNPLHAAGLLLDEAAALDCAEEASRSQLLARARNHLGRVGQGIGSLRQLAAVARPATEAVALDVVVGEVVRDLGRLAERDGIVVRVSAEPVKAQGDPTFIRIILENVICNSLDVLRARGGPGKVAIEVTRVERAALVHIHDDGPGIEAALAAKLFEPLATSKARGLGLGLSIARALSRAMKGELIYAQEPGWATTFLLRLALA